MTYFVVVFLKDALIVYMFRQESIAGCPNMTEKIVDWDEKHSQKQTVAGVLQVTCYNLTLCHLGLDATKHVFGVSDKVRFKPAFSTTETS